MTGFEATRWGGSAVGRAGCTSVLWCGRWPWGASVLWLALVAVSLLGRPLIPIDETRYAAVAWEMWSHGQFLVPHLNGAPYSHKPPLLFWLVHLGWAVFGVSEWWLRALPALFGLGSLWLLVPAARLLWPERRGLGNAAALLAGGSLLWALFAGFLMFDLLLTFFALLGAVGLLLAWRRPGPAGWAVFALAIALGVLTKGPVILLHVLPVALLAPWWRGGLRWRWYGGVLLATLAGAALALAWALPAARAGGPAYEAAILWGQTAGRVVESFAHRRAIWWYLPLLPLVWFPWFFWGRFWRALPDVRRPDPGLRFVLAWLVPVFAALTLISSKQPHYLLPLFPAVALLGARLLDRAEARTEARTEANGETSAAAGPRRVVVPGLLIAGIGLLWLVNALRPLQPALAWSHGLAVWPGIMLLVLGGAVIAAPPLRWLPQAALLSAATAGLLVAVSLGAFPRLEPGWDLSAAAARIARLQREGHPFAHVDHYSGQYDFEGRLRQPMTEITTPDIGPWLAAHPTGRVVVENEPVPQPPGTLIQYREPYRGHELAILAAAADAAGPAPSTSAHE